MEGNINSLTLSCFLYGLGNGMKPRS